jgi:bacterioferritin-associated ferredoxin
MDSKGGVEVAAGLWCGRRSKMIVCLCGGVSDREIREAIERSGGDLAAIFAATGAGRDCGGCHEEVKRHCRQPCPGSCPTQQTGYPTRRAG